MGEHSNNTQDVILEVKKVVHDIHLKISKYAVNLPSNIGDISLYLEFIQRLLEDINNLIKSTLSISVNIKIFEEVSDLDNKIKNLALRINMFVDKLLINPTSSPDSRFYIQMILDGLKRVKDYLIERGKKLKMLESRDSPKGYC